MRLQATKACEDCQTLHENGPKGGTRSVLPRRTCPIGAPQLATNFILRTNGMKNPAFYRHMVGAVGIEFAVHLISPADSVALIPLKSRKCS